MSCNDNFQALGETQNEIHRNMKTTDLDINRQSKTSYVVSVLDGLLKRPVATFPNKNEADGFKAMKQRANPGTRYTVDPVTVGGEIVL